MISRLFLAFNALAIGSIGLIYLYDPNILLARYDLQTGSVSMDNMLRSTYGGLFLLSAAIFCVGIFKRSRRRDSLTFVAIFMMGAAIGRIASIIAVGVPHATIMPLLYFEIIMSVLAVLLWVKSNPSAS